MLRKIENRIRRFAAFLLVIATFFTSIEMPVYAGDDDSNYLAGWTVQCAWSSLSTEYEWNAYYDEIRQPKIIVTYRLENAEQEYPAGSIHFTIPGIGYANRSGVVKAYKLAADSSDSEWSYTWDSTTDIYTFTNAFSVSAGESVSGGFELLWSFDARDCETEFEQEKSPGFLIDGVGAITMEPLSYHFTSVTDRYRIEMSREKLTATDYESADQSYVWYQIETRFDKDWLSRGLYRSDYYITVELPDGADYDDVAVEYDGKSLCLEQDESGAYGFCLFRSRSGDIGTDFDTFFDDFTIGFEKETLLEQEVTVCGHLDRLYHDESDWITEAGENEIVDDELTFTVEDYGFTHEGYIYDHHKYGSRYENSDHSAPDNYRDRMEAVNLYNGKVVQFYLYGSARRDYTSVGSSSAKASAYNLSSAAAVTATESDAEEPADQSAAISRARLRTSTKATASDAAQYRPASMKAIPKEIQDWNDIRWWEEEELLEIMNEDWSWTDTPTYGEIHPLETATSSDADGEDDKGFWFDIPLMNDLFSAKNKIGNLFSIEAYAAEATPSEADDDGISALSADHPTKPGGNATGVSQISKDQEYSLVMGDDKLAIFLNDGSVRNLEDEEYDIAYVEVPPTSKEYDYEIYIADTQDTHFDHYHYYTSGTTGFPQTVFLPTGVKAVFVRVNGVVGSYTYGVYVGVRLHLNWKEEQGNGVKAPDHENHIVNFSYLRALYLDEEGYEVNDCAMTTSEYLGSYGAELAERDLDVYEEQLRREYANVWLRSPVTNLGSETVLNSFSGDGQSGFSSRLTAYGTISADNSGELKKFSLYSVVPDGIQYDFDNTVIDVTGNAIDINGDRVTDFVDHVTISTMRLDGRNIVAADFDYSDNPLEISKETQVSVSFPVSLSYADYLAYGNRYTAISYTMVHDDGHDKISGRTIMADYMDLDGDGNTEEKIAYSNCIQEVSDTANEWREFVSKYVKSAYSSGYVTDTVTRLYQETDTDDNKEKSNYSYRLDFGLGSNHAKNITFYDHIEQGAVLKVNGNDSEETTKIPGEWQGDFVSVDTVQAEKLGLIPTVYYSEKEDQEFDLDAEGWTTELPSGDVRSVAVYLDTSNMEDGVMKTGQMAYVLINMRAPDDTELVGKYAVNQYTVKYDAYSISGEQDDRYVLPSAETRVRLLDTIGRIILQKADADHVIKTDEDGTEHYASLTGAAFQIYDSNKKPLFDEPKELNSLGRISLINVRYGTYYWEEVTAPDGYVREEGLHEFTIDGFSNTLTIKNPRMRGTVILTKTDADDPYTPPLKGAVYKLYNSSNGEQIFTDDDYAYSDSGTNGTFSTGEDGTFCVTNLLWGSYYFVESSAPEGYELNEQRIRFSIGKGDYDAENDRIEVSVSGEDYQKTAAILLKKIDEVSGKPVKDAVFSLYRLPKDGEDGDQLISSGLKTNAAGEIEISDLKFGSYYFTETRNPGGYIMPDEAHAVTAVVTLDSSTAEKILEITHTNARKNGSVSLIKKDNSGFLVGAAAFNLYHKGWGDTEYSLYGSYITGDDSNADTYGMIEISDMPWGDYYFMETSAPQGYVLSKDPIAFEIDEKTVQNTIYLNSVNELQTGSIRLKKVDKANPETVLAGAVYELYRTDGTKCVAGMDYTLPEGIETITTGEDGTITVNDIPQGGYYLQEITAPPSYSLSPELIRFSITKENAAVLQEFVAEDEKDTAVIRITKEIDEIYEPFGNPTFTFRITRSDGREYYRSITLSDTELTGTTSLAVEQGFPYTIEELTTARYRLASVIPGQNVTVKGDVAEADLVLQKEADVTFVNQLDHYDKFSHTSNASNLVKSQLKLTAVLVEYIGDAPITKDFPGYDSEEERYPIPKEDLVVTAFFDDGSSEQIDSSEFELSPEYADGNTNSYTGTVSYTYGGSTKSSSFQIDIDLPKPTERVMAVFQLEGGYIIPEGSESAQDSFSYQIKSGSTVSRPSNDPTKEGYRFLGWYTDSLYTEEAVFPYTIIDNTTFYAGWEQAAVKVKYAVSIYRILEDMDTDGSLIGLSFGPATGASYIDTYRSHTPSEGQMCMHDMSWEEIIEQSKNDPTVFSECMENGCTHSVQLTITGEQLMKDAVSYPDMEGDGAGALYHAINPLYRRWLDPVVNEWGAYYGGDADWPKSKIYATLNGKENCSEIADYTGDEAVSGKDALISFLPEELRNAVVTRSSSYKYGTSCSSNDRLWLMNKEDLAGRDSIINYDEEGNAADWWTRDTGSFRGFSIIYVMSNGEYGEVANDWTETLTDERNDMAVAFGFGLSGPVSATGVPKVKYAVSLYGIRHDTYSEDDGDSVGIAGLTFGPATGISCQDSFVSHEPDGITESGNRHRCIHEDDWSTIAEWSRKDPYVYEQCYGDENQPGCTKSVPLYLNSALYSGNYKKQSGDGASVLETSIARTYRFWNYTGSDCEDLDYSEQNWGTVRGGWKDSVIRNTLNGIVTDNMLYVTNMDNAFQENMLDKETSMFSCLPEELKAAIVPKAVKSTVTDGDPYQDDAETVITYDYLWLLSCMEIFGDADEDNGMILSEEGTQYERSERTGITSEDTDRNIAFNENASPASWDLRTVYDSEVCCVWENGDIYSHESGYDARGIAFGFSIR